MVICKYCLRPEDKRLLPCLECKSCKNVVHLECLLSKKTPGHYIGDVFFDFKCADCSETGIEILKRDKMSWLYVLAIALNHLSKKCLGISNNGFFHWQTHIASFIVNNWNNLFDPSCKRKRNFSGTFSGILSNWNNIFFESGTGVLKENGWWKIRNGFSPALVKYLYTEFSLWKQKDRKMGSSSVSDKVAEYFVMKRILSEIGFGDLLMNSNDVEKNEQTEKFESNPSSPKSEVQTDGSGISNREGNLNSDMEEYFSNRYLMDCSLMTNIDDMLLDFEESSESNISLFERRDDSFSQYFANEEDAKHKTPNAKYGGSIFDFNKSANDSTSTKIDPNVKSLKTKSSELYIAPPVKGLFSDSPKSNDLPWVNESKNKYEKKKPFIVSEYSEVQMLNHLNTVCRKAHFININKDLIRLRAKLSLRKLKRQRYLPIFNLDSLVSKLAYYPTEDYSDMSLGIRRVLDQFQHGSNVSSAHLNYALRLVVSYEISPFISPYSGNLLKPYIWRDFESRPLWLRLMEEMQCKANKNNPFWVKPSKSSLDYCYVRPQHIASINSLCSQFFWPGIDLSDTLLYPEFSCVVLYKKIIVAFAFLVPDVSLNEAYISFIFTRPEWRKSGIANVMLYHLTQTCIDKDITLHVSASNPAIFLYQKFGFKVEEFLQEFYDKYLPPDSKECKHALYLRLSRS